MDTEQLLRRYQPVNEQEARDREMMLRFLAEQPDVYRRDNPLVHFTASAWIVSPDRQWILLIFHNQYQSWSWTGGHADGETDLAAVAQREAREETGLAELRPLGGLASLELLPVPGHFKRGRWVATHLHANLTWLLEADRDAPLRARPEENGGVRWFPAATALAASSEPWLRDTVYRKLMERLRQL